MALALETSGTTTATGGGVEDTLATLTGTKFYQLVIDTVNMVDGDTLEIKVKSKVLNGGTTRLEQIAVYTHGQVEPIKRSLPFASDQELVFTITQSGAGTDKAFPWKVMSW